MSSLFRRENTRQKDKVEVELKQTKWTEDVLIKNKKI